MRELVIGSTAVRVSVGHGVGVILKGHGGVDAAYGAGPHVGSLDGPARVSPGEEPGGGPAPTQEASAEMQPLRESRLPAATGVFRIWVPWGVAPAAFHVEGECAGGFQLPLLLPSLAPGSSDGQDAVSISSLEQRRPVPCCTPTGISRPENPIISLN